MSGDVHVRFCERPRVRPPRATHLLTVAATPVHLAIHVPASFASRVRVSHLRVDDTHGDAYTVWVSQGMPASPSAAEVATLRQAMEPSPLVKEYILELAGNSEFSSFRTLHSPTPSFEVANQSCQGRRRAARPPPPRSNESAALAQQQGAAFALAFAEKTPIVWKSPSLMSQWE